MWVLGIEPGSSIRAISANRVYVFAHERQGGREHCMQARAGTLASTSGNSGLLVLVFPVTVIEPRWSDLAVSDY